MAGESLPTPRELEILKVLWRQGPSSVRSVCEELNRQRRRRHREPLAYTTVQTMLRLMEEKGLVTHRLQGRTFIYTARYTRQDTVTGFVQRVFDGAARDLVVTLLQSESLSPEELAAIQEMIASARQRLAKDKKDKPSPTPLARSSTEVRKSAED